MLLNRVQSLGKKFTNTGQYFLWFVVLRYDPTVVREGARPDMTPLHYSIIREDDSMSVKLIRSGASVNIRDRYARSLFHATDNQVTCLEAQNVEALRMFLQWDLFMVSHKQEITWQPDCLVPEQFWSDPASPCGDARTALRAATA